MGIGWLVAKSKPVTSPRASCTAVLGSYRRPRLRVSFGEMRKSSCTNRPMRWFRMRMVHARSPITDCCGRPSRKSPIELPEPTGFVFSKLNWPRTVSPCVRSDRTWRTSKPVLMVCRRLFNVKLGRDQNPPLTTIRSHPEQVGRVAAEILMEQLNGEPAPSRVAVPTDLAVRGSTAPPKRD